MGIASDARFVGIDNYIKLLDDDLFVKALVNTSYYAAGSIFLIVPAALGLALVFTIRHLRFREFFRLFFFSPNITSGVVVAIIFGLVFNEDYGLLNNFILIPLGLEKVRWLREPVWIMPAIIIMGLWRFTGINALYFMAGLQNIPPEVKEAAIIDALSLHHLTSAAPGHDLRHDLRHYRLVQPVWRTGRAARLRGRP